MSDKRRPRPVTTLLIGFDSAWTSQNYGALVGVVRKDDGPFQELGPPQTVNFKEAADAISNWQREKLPDMTIVALDQPTIVRNAAGQRPVENLVSSPVGLRYGGMQPANTSHKEMFGSGAPVWQFLDQFAGAADPLNPTAVIQVFETYPVLAMIALGWIVPDSFGGRATGRLPKYNPEQRRTFSIDDWLYVCDRLSDEIDARGIPVLSSWVNEVKAKDSPCKSDQDGLDACICLLVALYLSEWKDCLMVGDLNTGYIVVPYGDTLRKELEKRCVKTNRDPSAWVRPVSPNADR